MSSNQRMLFGLAVGLALGTIGILGGPKMVIGGLIVLFCWGVDQICEAIRESR